MRKLFNVLNVCLFFLVCALVALGVRTWTHPRYSLDIQIDAVQATASSFQPIAIENKKYQPAVINAVVGSNIFRPDRKEYTRPVQVVSAPPPPPPPPQAPPPDLKLSGVLLLPGKPVAFLEGTVNVLEGGRTFTRQPVKRKAYPLGARIGEYQLASIEKTSVTLDNARGAKLQLKIAKRGTGGDIDRKKGALTQKSENFDPAKIRPQPKPVTPPPPAKTAAPRPAPGIRISGAASPLRQTKQIPAGIPRPRISGR